MRGDHQASVNVSKCINCSLSSTGGSWCGREAGLPYCTEYLEDRPFGREAWKAQERGQTQERAIGLL